MDQCFPSVYISTSHWKPDYITESCQQKFCNRRFWFLERRHHCRLCGKIVCSYHSTRQLPLSNTAKLSKDGVFHRVCDTCYESVLVHSGLPLNANRMELKKAIELSKDQFNRVASQREFTTEETEMIESILTGDSSTDSSCSSSPEAQRKASIKQSLLMRMTESLLAETQIEEEKTLRDQKKLQELLKQYNMSEFEVPPDGNCMFASIADQLYRMPSLHRVVRGAVVKQLQSNKDLYETFVTEPFDEYCERMSQDGEYGDHVCLQAAADKFSVQINVITTSKVSFIEIIPHETESITKPLWLSYRRNVHYNSLYPVAEIEFRNLQASKANSFQKRDSFFLPENTQKLKHSV